MERWSFGEAPLDETRELAAALRDLMGTALALEHPSAELRELVGELARRAANGSLRSLPADLRPRIGDDAGPRRGVSTSTTPATSATTTRASRSTRCDAHDDRAEGRVTFPVVYEGPPGVVHGGFLAVFFDCALQQLSCDMGARGRRVLSSVRYRRPVPILTELELAAERTVAEGSIHSTASCASTAR